MRPRFPTGAIWGMALSTIIVLGALAGPAAAQPADDDVFDSVLLSSSTLSNNSNDPLCGPVPQPYCGPQPHLGPAPRPYDLDAYDPGAIDPGLTQPAPAPDLFAAAPQAALGASNMIAAAYTGVGYIDPAVPMTQIRFRLDGAYGNNSPDRAEFFYPKCGCFRDLLPPGHPLHDPNAPGPPLPETELDYYDIAVHLEYALNERFSVFTELPLRFVQPEVNQSQAGFSDMNFGFKYALIARPDQFWTFQFRTYAPTGNGRRGLGNEHFTVEPGLLYFRRFTERLMLESEVRHWIPIDGTSGHAGNITRYGIGLGYTIYDDCCLRITPVSEFVGWTVWDGQRSTPDGRLLDASGDTIVNAKIGVRFGFGPLTHPLGSANSLYVGYGRALTGHVWYQDIFRVEYRMIF